MVLLPKDFWEVKKTATSGRGLFARKTIQQGAVIGDYLGEIVHITEVDIRDEKENMFLMAFGEESAIVPDLSVAGAHLINHSCTPNTSLYPYRGHTLFVALRKISAGEEVTISYNLAPKDGDCEPCTHTCRCLSTDCSGTMHLSPERYKLWRDFWDKVESESKALTTKSGDFLTALESYPEKIDVTKWIKIGT